MRNRDMGRVMYPCSLYATVMRRSFIRQPLKLTSSVSQYFDCLPSVIAVSLFNRRSSTAVPPPQIEGLQLDRAASPIDGCDYEHWLVVMDPPTGYPLRHQIVQLYIQTLATALGSEEEAKRSIYTVSTKYYYAFGCKIHESETHGIKSLPNVRWVLPDSYGCLGGKDYGGEPFMNGCVVPYDELFHEDWLLDRTDDGFRKRTRRRRCRGKEKKVQSD